MAWTLTTLSGAIYKAGANRNSMFDQASGAVLLNIWSSDVEGTINAVTRRDWVALSGSTTANFKGVLSDLASDMIAMKIISYDMSGYTSLNEASTMCDILRDNAVRNLEILKLEENKEKML